VIAFHGTADPVDPYLGNGQTYWTYSVPVAAQRWAAHDGCTATPKSSQPVAGVALEAYSGCRNRAAVELYTLSGEGHEWPGGPTLPAVVTRLLGPQSRAVNADDVMWAFFAAHPMP
jgi:polyhydroxybutyrate depolymerase